jgi:hypothetical protein
VGRLLDSPGCFDGVVGFDDFAQSLFVGPVTIVGVRMELLGQSPEVALDGLVGIVGFFDCTGFGIKGLFPCSFYRTMPRLASGNWLNFGAKFHLNLGMVRSELGT